VGNVIYNGTNRTVAPAISLAGTAAANTSVLIAGNVMDSLTGTFYATDAAGIALDGFAGSAMIVNNVFKDLTSTSTAGAHIGIWGAGTGKIHIGPNSFGGGTNMTVGVYVDAAVPSGAVTIAPGSSFGTSVTTKWSLGAAVNFPVDRCYQMEEITDPAAPAANQVRVYARDTGGKTELVARFPTGAVQRLAIEP
jgi:hypothetical protein